jgi:predicted O-methyltransferase YrrM
MYKDLVRDLKLKHVLKSVIKAKRALREIKYRWSFTSEIDFVRFLSGTEDSLIELILDDFRRLENYFGNVDGKLSKYPGGYGCQMTQEVRALYILVRLFQPEKIIETGVAAGRSSFYILKALHDNGKGKLYSIDIPPNNLPKGESSGWIVPEDLKNRWALKLGRSFDILLPLIKSLGSIDVFIHDSDHSYENMIWEFQGIYPLLRKGGLFLAHDVGRNNAFYDFCKQQGLSWKNVRTFHVLAGFRKN